MRSRAVRTEDVFTLADKEPSRLFDRMTVDLSVDWALNPWQLPEDELNLLVAMTVSWKLHYRGLWHRPWKTIVRLSRPTFPSRTGLSSLCFNRPQKKISSNPLFHPMALPRFPPGVDSGNDDSSLRKKYKSILSPKLLSYGRVSTQLRGALRSTSFVHSREREYHPLSGWARLRCRTDVGAQHSVAYVGWRGQHHDLPHV